MNVEIENKLKNILFDLKNKTDNGILDAEDYSFKENLKSSREEFKEIHSFLEKLSDSHSNYNSHFPEQRRYFVYDNTKLIWRRLHGQGTANQFLLEKENSDWPDGWPMIFEDEMAVIL